MKGLIRNRILIFVRYPVPGEVKTRLIPVLGPAGAARLHRRMAESVVDAARAWLKSRDDAGITVCCIGAPVRAFRAWLGQDLLYAAQPSGDLGDRMGTAFRTALAHGSAAICIGSDLPFITPAVLARALEDLRDHDVVLGPADDGGYYLIGMKRFCPELFSNVTWGTERVWEETGRIISRMGLSMARLPMLGDVDRPGDLEMIRNDPRFSACFAGKPLLSVIIPTLNEENHIAGALDRIRQEGVEIIVADGGSRDRTREIAAQAGVSVLEVPGGRALQQNAGAMAARGSLLLFLHADTLLPCNFADLIREALDDPSTVAGAFRFRTDGTGPAIRIVEWGANLRSACLHLPYGDQGLFMEKRAFAEMGGFAPIPIMEDFELIRRLRQRGRVTTLRESAVTSARRWRQLGAARTTLINMIMIAGFYCGIPVERLGRFYRKQRQFAEKSKTAP